MVRPRCAPRMPVGACRSRAAQGAGKTYATEAVVATHVAQGIPMVGCSVSASCSVGAGTIPGRVRPVCDASHHRCPGAARTRWSATTVSTRHEVVVDEASMLGPETLPDLPVTAALRPGGVVLVGDPDQHGAVEVGRSVPSPLRRPGRWLVRLVDNNRQEDHVERLAIDDYRNGHVTDAARPLRPVGQGRAVRRTAESFDAMVADWYAARLCEVATPGSPGRTRHAAPQRTSSCAAEGRQGS